MNLDSAGKLPAVAFRRGDRLGRYELVCQLAEGGMGEVWLANATGPHGFERAFALKMILPEYQANARFRTMFLDEAKIASKIVHENVVSILDVGEENGTLFFAMEYVEGESVRRFQKTLLEHDALSFGLSLRVVIEACAGLHAAHELCDVDGRHLEIVHRDISPHNLLLTPRGQVKIIDFGVARAKGRLAQPTESGTLKGKLEYMSPEQARGGEVDRRADIYSLGAVLYSLLVGRAPYDAGGGDHVAILTKILAGDPAAPPPSFVSQPIREVIEIALAPNPKGRFRTAAEFGHALEQAMVASGATASTSDLASAFSKYLMPAVEKRREMIRRALLELKRPADGRASATMHGLGGFLSVRAPQASVPTATPVGTAATQIEGGSNQSTVRGMAPWVVVPMVVTFALLGLAASTFGKKGDPVSASVELPGATSGPGRQHASLVSTSAQNPVPSLDTAMSSPPPPVASPPPFAALDPSVRPPASISTASGVTMHPAPSVSPTFTARKSVAPVASTKSSGISAPTAAPIPSSSATVSPSKRIIEDGF